MLQNPLHVVCVCCICVEVREQLADADSCALAGALTCWASSSALLVPVKARESCALWLPITWFIHSSWWHYLYFQLLSSGATNAVQVSFWIPSSFGFIPRNETADDIDYFLLSEELLCRCAQCHTSPLLCSGEVSHFSTFSAMLVYCTLK